MKAEKIFCAMNDIKDEYVVEYAKKEKAVVPKTFFQLRAWRIIAACFVLVIICTPAIVHIFNPSEFDDPKAGAHYEFGSYSELCNALPDGNILAKIPNSKEATISANVECPDGTTNFAEYANYSYLNIDISYNNSTGVSIFCVINSEKTAKDEIENKILKYPSEEIGTTTISGCDIYYTSYENGIDKVNIATFSYDGDLFEFTTVTFSQEELIQYIGDMLNS